MCGIAGVFRYRSERPIDDRILREMQARMRHRGPDDEGICLDGRIGLAHTRLSIVDLSPMGHQPFRDESGRFTLVYNGEIYNHLELRRWLEARGHTFRSRSDTETLLRAYMELGSGVVDRLIGMFAFAVWDAREESLFLARDRAGEKPLVYAEYDGSLTFASEIHALLADPDVPRTPDEVGLLAYLGTGKCVPYPRTAYAHVRKLPPGHTLTVSRAGLAIRRYWAPDFSRKVEPGIEAAVEQLDAVLGTVASSMLMGDVPIGLLLSGGVDSSTIAFAMRRCIENMHTFACGASAGDEELSRARWVAGRLRTRHAEHVFELRPEAMLDVLRLFGEPIAEPSVIYRAQMCEFLRRQGMTVILSGDGGDEVFGGYASYSLLLRYPGVKRALAGLFAGDSLLRSLPGVETNLLPRVEIHGRPVPAAVGDALGRTMHGNLSRLGCVHPAAREAIEEVRSTVTGWLEAARVTDLVDAVLFRDLMVTLHHNHVMISDAVGMSESLEIRSPYLDVRVIEFAASLPSRYKVCLDPLQNKPILKRLLERHLPADLVYATKIGYGGNIQYLGKHAEAWSALVGRLLDTPALSRTGLTGRAELQRLADAGSSRSSYEQIALMGVVMLGLWLDTVDGTGSVAEAIADAFPARIRQPRPA